jgi:hypothetical protein
MFNKIKRFFSSRKETFSGLSYVEQQIDQGLAVLEMLDKAKVLGADVIVTVRVGEVIEEMSCPGGRGELTDSLYQVLSRSVRFWIDEYMKSGVYTESMQRVWDRVYRRLFGDGEKIEPPRG